LKIYEKNIEISKSDKVILYILTSFLYYF